MAATSADFAVLICGLKRTPRRLARSAMAAQFRSSTAKSRIKAGVSRSAMRMDLSCPVYCQRTERLGHWHQLNRIDVHPRRQSRHPIHGFGDILGCKRITLIVDLRCSVLIAFETHNRKLRAADQSRFDVGYSHLSSE